MHIKIDRSDIISSVQKVQSVVSTKGSLPSLANILFSAEDSRLTLFATDLDISIRTVINASIAGSGSITLPGKRIANILKEMPHHEIEMETDDLVVSVQSGSAFFKIIGMSSEDFPPIPEFEGSFSYTLKQGVLKEMINKTAYATALSDSRAALSGLLLQFKDEKVTMVGTDGRRLALVEQEVEFPKDFEEMYILPQKLVTLLTATLGDGEDSVLIKATKNQISFEFADHFIISKLIVDTFPNYRQVVPSQSEHRVVIERELFINAVHRVALMADEDPGRVRMTFEDNHLEITTQAAQIGEAREIIPVRYENESISVAFNPGFLIEPLRKLTSDEIFFEFTNQFSAGVFKCDIPFLYVIMPVRLSN